MAQAYDYPYDPTGTKGTNLVKDFPIKLDRTNARALALTGPFYGRTLTVRSKLNQSIVLKENVDYRLLYIHEELFDLVDSPVYSIVYFHNADINGDYLADFQMLGGNKQGNASIIQQMIDNIKNDSRDVYLENIIDFPSVLPPEGHLHHIANTYGYENAIDIFNQILAYLRAADNELGLNITNQINGINTKYNELLALISDMEDSNSEGLDSIRTQIDAILEDIAELKRRVTALEEALDTFKQTTNASLSKNSAEIKANRDAIAALADSVNDRFTTVNNALSVHDQQFTDVNKELSEVSTTLDQHGQTFTNHQGQIDLLKGRVTVNEDDIEELKSKTTSIGNDNSNIAKVLTSATAITTTVSNVVAHHNGNHTLPSLSSVDTGHLIQVHIHSGYKPVFVVKNTGSERVSYLGDTDTSIKFEDTLTMTFVKISSNTWGVYS